MTPQEQAKTRPQSPTKTAGNTVTVSPLRRPVSALWGVGGERAKQLERLGISTIEDLLLHRPRRYEDRRDFRPIAKLQLSEPALTRGTVVASGLKHFRKGAKSVFELILDDGTARLHCRWWNLPFMEKYFEIGDEVVVTGANNYFELWNKARWEAERATSQEQTWHIIESLETRE